MMKNVFDILYKKGLTIGFAESMTGGFCSYQLIQYPKASSVIKGSIIAYSNQIKNSLLGISLDLIEQESVVSQKVAIQMAKSIKRIVASDIGVGITGNAGPDLEPNTYKKIAWIAMDYRDLMVTKQIDLSRLDRNDAILFTTQNVYQMLEEILS